MKRFRFRLQTLLDQRKSHEEQLLAELGELRRQEALEIMKLREMEAELIEIYDQIAKSIGAHIDLLETARLNDYSNALQDDIKVQELTIEGIKARVEEKRLEVIEAMKQRKVLEALKDKQEQAHIKAALKVEQDMLDEMASVRYARGM